MTGPNPESLLWNAQSIYDVGIFLYMLSTWASQSPDPQAILDHFVVDCITHNKNPVAPEHEYLIIETKDLVKEDVFFLILERTISNEEVDSLPVSSKPPPPLDFSLTSLEEGTQLYS